MKDHIRDERATREKYKLVGSGLELEDRNDTRTLCVAFCGQDASGAWFYRSIDYVATQAKRGEVDGVVHTPSVCDGCVDAVVAIMKTLWTRAT